MWVGFLCLGFSLVGWLGFFPLLHPSLNCRDLVLNGAMVVNDHERRVNVQRGGGLVEHLMSLW